MVWVNDRGKITESGVHRRVDYFEDEDSGSRAILKHREITLLFLTDLTIFSSKSLTVLKGEQTLTIYL